MFHQASRTIDTFPITTDDVEGAETHSLENVYWLALSVQIVQNVDQDLGLLVHDLHEVVEDLEMERGRDQAPSGVPFVATTISYVHGQ